jgi:methyl-accepting chemotaxis protein
MDEITQQNAALVEEAAAAAESLQEQAAKLSELVENFKLAQSARSVARPRPVPARAGSVREMAMSSHDRNRHAHSAGA